MTNKIPFPKNYERFIQLGKEATSNNNLNEAIDYFLQAYEIRQDFPLNLLISSTYLDIGDNEQALFLASEMKEEYLSCLDYIELYVQMLIQNHKFIDAHCLINERILLEQSGELKRLISLKQKIRQVELMYQEFEVRKIKKLTEELEELSKHHYYEQLAIVKKAGKLPQEEFVSIGKKILVDKKVHNLVRSWILEEFAKLHIKEEIEFLWRDDQMYVVVPAIVGSPLDCGAYQRILLFLEKELVNNDPILLADVLEEVRVHFAILYPLSDNVVKNPKLWAISYLATYNPDMIKKYQMEESVAAIQKTQQLQDKIRFELASMTL